MVSNMVISSFCEQFPKCFILVTCPPYNVLHGSVHYNQPSNNGRYNFGTVVSLTCDPGFRVTASGAIIQCQIAEIWSSHINCFAGE